MVFHSVWIHIGWDTRWISTTLFYPLVNDIWIINSSQLRKIFCILRWPVFLILPNIENWQHWAVKLKFLFKNYLYFQIKTSDFRFACAVGNINHVIKNCMLKDYHMINILIQTCILIIIASILYFISELLY